MHTYHTIGVIAPMGEEEAEILKHLHDVHEDQRKAGLIFQTGASSSDQQVIVVCAGIGKVNAALCTQLLIDLYQPDAILNVGVAGGLGDSLSIGDIVISTCAQEHDMDCGGIGDPRGVIPRMETSVFEADPELIQKASAAAKKHDIPYQTGKVLSGDQFICSNEIKQDLVKTFDGLCAEMEGAAVAHVCYLNQVPFLIIRAISDQANDDSLISYEAFLQIAAERAGLICAGILGTI